MESKYMDEKILIKINSILEHINQVLEDTKGVSLEELRKSNSLLRTTCFSVAQIGEMMNQLEKALAEKYWNLPWMSARKMRNIVVHDYCGTDVEQVYFIIHNDLPFLKTSFSTIINDIAVNALITDRCILRKVRKEDAIPMFNNWANDPEVTKYLTWNPHENIEITKMIIDSWLEEENNPKTFRYMITLKDSGELIGSIDVVRYIDDNPEIGYCLSKKYWNQGLMTEVCKEFTKYLFNIGFKKIFINAVKENIGSNRVIEKCGFKFTHQEKLEHQSSFKPGPVTINCYEINKNTQTIGY